MADRETIIAEYTGLKQLYFEYEGEGGDTVTLNEISGITPVLAVIYQGTAPIVSYTLGSGQVVLGGSAGMGTQFKGIVYYE